ncbi:hypothetical protein, partial [Novosphingobium sp. SG751A]|uniref:hypothetical protein n=1 Tax=Novosphingobium sp. SG751A TaxID=2587000 RepID=UPI001C129A0F
NVKDLPTKTADSYPSLIFPNQGKQRPFQMSVTPCSFNLLRGVHRCGVGASKALTRVGQPVSEQI